ncbi:mandelate racemase/muconate lactonizing enzyme family protein [Ancylobacter sp. MQZ15Z-1]|uniref:Mandelate racemase/muconate lactonizing enzyme family protein n=1 Tax=Ancylobacter mangrovi TaxID=2972472 RepID=A0A9X2T5E5_9HYPH|nr:mandelate racemase/muconate lactonizing enzyme family protein [Ancylobacter mangrovi]MCS0497196.1 mandelate racemase/muconate lactonizing enzyme family protein [Ancylobacter mangrovi]
MTKIESVTAHALRAPLKRKHHTAHEPRDDVTLILVEIRSSDGHVGYGQVSSTPMKEICGWIDRLSEAVIGMDALSPLGVWEKLFSLTAPRVGGGGLPRGARPQIMGAIGGIDMAMWDLQGKAANLPVFRILGAENRPIFTYATGGYYVEGEKLTACADEMASFVAAGFRAVKLKTGARAMQEEVARIRATREAIGDDVGLMLDMNGAYDLSTCIEFANAVAPYDITWLEEPLHWYLQPADFRLLADASPVALAHGEREITRFTCRDFITSGAIRYMQFDATRYAGFTEALRVAHLADHHGVLISPHHAPELHCHLVAAFPRGGYAVESHGSPHRDPIWHGIYADRAQIRDSFVYMNEKPGFGYELNWDYIEKNRA